MRKVGIVLIAFMVFFTSLLGTQKEVHAFAPAVALPLASGAGYATAGIYAITGLLVASGAGYLGYEHADEIKAHATGVWGKMDDANRAIWTSAIESQITADTSNLVINQAMSDSLSTGLSGTWDWLKSKLLMKELETTVYPDSSLDTLVKTGTYPSVNQATASTAIDPKLTFTIDGHVGNSFSLNFYGGNKVMFQMRKLDQSTYSTAYMAIPAGMGFSGSGTNYTSFAQILALAGAVGVGITTAYQDINVPDALTLKDGFDATMAGLATGAKEINLALDKWLAKTDTAQPLVFDPSANAGAGGMTLDGAPYSGNWSWEVPKLGLRVPSIPGVDAPTITNPSVPLEQVVGRTVSEDGTTTVETDFVGTKTGTGAETGTGEYTGVLGKIEAGIATIVALLTSGLIGSPEAIKWDRLKMAGAIVTTQFPFSLPWDVGKGLDAIFGGFTEGDPPVWVWVKYGWEFRFPELMVSWSPFIKSVLLITFDISLVYAVRKLLGGAS